MYSLRNITLGARNNFIIWVVNCQRIVVVLFLYFIMQCPGRKWWILEKILPFIIFTKREPLITPFLSSSSIASPNSGTSGGFLSRVLIFRIFWVRYKVVSVLDQSCSVWTGEIKWTKIQDIWGIQWWPCFHQLTHLKTILEVHVALCF